MNLRVFQSVGKMAYRWAYGFDVAVHNGLLVLWELRLLVIDEVLQLDQVDRCTSNASVAAWISIWAAVVV